MEAGRLHPQHHIRAVSIYHPPLGSWRLSQLQAGFWTTLLMPLMEAAPLTFLWQVPNVRGFGTNKLPKVQWYCCTQQSLRISHCLFLPCQHLGWGCGKRKGTH